MYCSLKKRYMLVVYTKEHFGNEGDEPSPRRGHVFDLLV